MLLFTSICHGESYRVLPSYDRCIVTQVVDGDTIKASCIYRQNVIIRLLDVDTFEVYRTSHAKRQAKQCHISIDKIIMLGQTETDFVKQLLPINAPILIQLYDKRYGYYNRLLGDIWTIKDGRWLNVNIAIKLKHEELVKLNCNTKE